MTTDRITPTVNNGTSREELLKTERNWSIWRAFHTKRLTLAEAGAPHGLNRERTRQIKDKGDRRIRNALSRTTPPADDLREAILGVEFVFSHELIMDEYPQDTRVPNRYFLKKSGDWMRLQSSHPLDDGIIYRISKED